MLLENLSSNDSSTTYTPLYLGVRARAADEIRTAFLLSQFDGDLEFKNITTDNFTKMLPANNTIKDF